MGLINTNHHHVILKFPGTTDVLISVSSKCRKQFERNLDKYFARSVSAMIDQQPVLVVSTQ